MFRTFSRIKVAVAVLALAAVAGLAALATGTALKSTPPLSTPQPDVTRYTGDRDLDVIIHALITGDAAALEARFADVTAREGVLTSLFGLTDSLSVPTSEWTSRLASGRRALHAVVKDPKEPFEWWDQAPPSVPRAAVFARPREFDVVLVVTADDGVPRPWRVSLAKGRAVDVVIAAVASDDARSLVRLLGYLTPSPDAEPGRFLVLPPDEMRPAPPRIPPVGRAPPAPVRSPSLAPDGRTGLVAIDTVIDELLTADAGRLLSTYRDLPARHERCDPGCVDVRLSPSGWTGRLAAGGRSLYSVFTGDPADAEIVIAVQFRNAPVEAWQLSAQAGRIVHVALHAQPVALGVLPVQVLVPGHPSPAREYDRFFVLPPFEDLPKPPHAHALSTRTGRGGVDALVAALEARDPARLGAAFAEPASPLVRACVGTGFRNDAGYATTWSSEIATEFFGLHSVSQLPAGYQPQADHLLVVYRQLSLYWWEAAGILERNGRIIGVITGEGCSPASIYPPARYLVPPPPGGIAGIDPSRRSGIALIDAILNAAAARDEVAMGRLIEYTPIACGDATGFPPHAGPPPCPTGVAAGKPVDILPEVVCAGNHVPRERAPRALIDWIGIDHPSGLYAATQPSRSTEIRVVIASSRGGAVALSIGERGVKQVTAGCGPLHPDTFLGSATPTFLLPPP